MATLSRVAAAVLLLLVHGNMADEVVTSQEAGTNSGAGFFMVMGGLCLFGAPFLVKTTLSSLSRGPAKPALTAAPI